MSAPGSSVSDGSSRSLRIPASAVGAGVDRPPSRVLRVDPPDGARGVFRDAPVVVCLSHGAEPSTVSPETFLVFDEQGAVPGGVWTTLDGRIAVWTPRPLLSAGKLHCVRLAGLRDCHGRSIPVHESAFVPCEVSLNDLLP